MGANFALKLSKKIKYKKASVGIIGVGYVGSALGLALSLEGFSVTGFVRTLEKAERINKQKNKNFNATNNFSLLSECDIICVCVPTPIFFNKKPDLRPLNNALSEIASNLIKGQMIIIESSVAAGTTRNFALPVLCSKSILIPEKDFFLAFSPERVDPGNKKFLFKNIPKVVSGLGANSLKLATEFYKNIVEKVVPVSSLEVGEMTKLLENTFRLVNISLVNEIYGYTRSLGINIWEVISAASTKPFGFLAHYPGPGVGGHCIPVDPYYLLDDARRRGISLKIIEHAGNINDEQSEKVVDRALKILNKTNGKLRKNKILLIGISYKPDVSDIRESPAIKIWELLQKQGHDVSYHDPYVPNVNGYSSYKLSPKVILKHDLIIVTTHHSAIDYSKLIKYKKPILDTRNVFNGKRKPNVFSL